MRFKLALARTLLIRTDVRHTLLLLPLHQRMPSHLRVLLDFTDNAASPPPV